MPQLIDTRFSWKFYLKSEFLTFLLRVIFSVVATFFSFFFYYQTPPSHGIIAAAAAAAASSCSGPLKDTEKRPNCSAVEGIFGALIAH